MRSLSTSIGALALISQLVLVAGCHSAQSDWEKASSLNTIAAYQDFLNKHPNDERATEAKAMIRQQEDNDAWDIARHEGSVVAYQGYLEKYPQGAHAPAAKTAMIDINRAADWKTAQSGDAAAVQAFLNKYPAGAEVDQAKEWEVLQGVLGPATTE